MKNNYEEVKLIYVNKKDKENIGLGLFGIFGLFPGIFFGFNKDNYKNKGEEKGEEKIRIFGDKFVENNKDNCKIYYNGKEKELRTYIMKKDFNNNNKIEVILRKYKDVVDMSFMFYDCNSLLSISYITKWNMNNVTDMSYMFYGCNSLTE